VVIVCLCVDWTGSCAVGRQCFREFLKSEFSEENVEFWIACEDYKNLKLTTTNLTAPAQRIYSEFIAHQAPREVDRQTETHAKRHRETERGVLLAVAYLECAKGALGMGYVNPWAQTKSP